MSGWFKTFLLLFKRERKERERKFKNFKKKKEFRPESFQTPHRAETHSNKNDNNNNNKKRNCASNGDGFDESEIDWRFE